MILMNQMKAPFLGGGGDENGCLVLPKEYR